MATRWSDSLASFTIDFFEHNPFECVLLTTQSIHDLFYFQTNSRHIVRIANCELLKRLTYLFCNEFFHPMTYSWKRLTISILNCASRVRVFPLPQFGSISLLLLQLYTEITSSGNQSELFHLEKGIAIATKPTGTRHTQQCSTFYHLNDAFTFHLAVCSVPATDSFEAENWVTNQTHNRFLFNFFLNIFVCCFY